MTEPSTRIDSLRKLLRFAGMYGWRRAINKAAGRTRSAWLRMPFVRRNTPAVSVIGCGQFAFSTICFFLQKHRGNAFLDAFDTDSGQARSLVGQYGFQRSASTPETLLANPALRLLYVASNHASHTPYAVAGLRRQIDVYVEKPIAVSQQQLIDLTIAQRTSAGRLFAGYNRPYARAVGLLRDRVRALPDAGGFSLNYVVNGHQIPASHWYRRPDEGTRICGNLGHWLDLTVHILAWRSLPDWLDIRIAWANPDEPDDNLSLSLTSDRHDIVGLLLTSRSEPFDGISEQISLQYGNLIAQVDDFRHLTVWQGHRRNHWRFRPKDVGHERAVLQPFRTDNRDWREVELSTLLMLHIRDQVLARQADSRFILADELARLDAAVATGGVSLLSPVV